jgi:hypothetical protein
VFPLLSSVLGGSGEDYGYGIALGGDSAYITGYTLSADFPTTPGAYDMAIGSANSDAFVAKISAAAPPPSS